MADETPDVEIKYGVKELLAIQGKTLERIESKVDANALTHAEAIGKLDTRVTLLEARPDLEPRVKVLEDSRSESHGAQELGRFALPLMFSLAIIVVGILTAIYH